MHYVPILFFLQNRNHMDWARAIGRNSEALVGIVGVLFVMLGLVGGAMVARIPRSVHRAVLRVLRPAKSAMRRLIVIAARGLVVKLVPSRPMPAGVNREGRGRPPTRLPALRPAEKHLRIDLRRGTLMRNLPRIHFFGPRFQVGGPVASTPARGRPLRRPMAWSMASASTAGSRPSSSRSMICRARPGDSPAGG